MNAEIKLNRRECVAIIDPETDHSIIVARTINGVTKIDLIAPPHEAGPPLLSVEIDGSSIRAIRGRLFHEVLNAIRTGADDIDRGVDTK